MRQTIEQRLGIEPNPNLIRVKVDGDIRIAQKININPREKVWIPVFAPDLIKNFRGYKIGLSLRSRRAQSGLDFPGDTADIFQTLLRVQESGVSPSTVWMPLQNITDRPQFLRKNTGFVAVNGSKGTEYFGRNDLENLVDNKHIRLASKNGTDWEFWSDESGENHGIKFYIDPDSRRWIPPSRRRISIPNRGHSREFRKYLEKKLFKPFEEVPPPTDRDFLTVAESSTDIHLADNLIGVIDRRLDNPGNKTHVHCELLYGGNTHNWPFRFENVVKPGKKPPEFVIVSFAIKE